jgi:choline dehydrogenase-like flavoprotein
MNDKIYDYLIVGSGAGGATLAQELAQRKKDVLVVETGKIEEKVGEFDIARKFYDGDHLLRIPRKSKEGVIIWRTLMAGGTTVVSCGNGVRCLEKELNELGINLQEEFAQVEKELQVAPISERLLSNGSKRIRQAATDLGINMELMPKMINPEICRKCGNCVLGCVEGAKWTALNYLKSAMNDDCEVVFESNVKKVITENGRVKGVMISGKSGKREILAKKVILSAGGIGTPIILQNSGIEGAGTNLFVDLFLNVYGTTEDERLNQVFEPGMTLVSMDFHKSKGFLISPYVNHSNSVKFLEFGLKGFVMSDKKTLGLMVKTTDDPIGHVYPNGFISKPVTENDRKRLKEGVDVAKGILQKAGAKSIKISRLQGGHPGGTAAIGKVVDKNLQTKIEGLFLCDASVLPVTPGLPPILTIVALAKKLAKSI